jgi:thymidylate kinase
MPPEGRDLDLLVRHPEAGEAAALLAAEGFLNRNEQWVAFKGCSAQVVDLVPASDWDLPEGEIGELFEEARAADGLKHLVVPSPRHQLLIMARKLAGGADLTPARKARVERALSEDPEAWTRAAASAAAWGAAGDLELLRSVLDGKIRPRRGRIGRVAGALGRLRRGRVVALSGLDGSGKSSQAESLRDTLLTLGYDAVVVWNRLAVNPSLDIVAVPIKRLLRLLPAKEPAPRSSPPPDDEEWDRGTELRRRSVVVTELWACVVALWNAISHRRSMQAHLLRGRIVICDRFVLDSAVNLRFQYGMERSFRFQKWLVRAISPSPTAAFNLRISARVAHERKPVKFDLDELEIFERLYDEERSVADVEQLNGELPEAAICTTIATSVWESLRRTP